MLLPLADDIIVQDINTNLIVPTIVESECEDMYYVSIPITEAMYCKCKLILRFCKFNIALNKLSRCEAKEVKCCSKAWKWIPTMSVD